MTMYSLCKNVGSPGIFVSACLHLCVKRMSHAIDTSFPLLVVRTTFILLSPLCKL